MGGRPNGTGGGRPWPDSYDVTGTQWVEVDAHGSAPDSLDLWARTSEVTGDPGVHPCDERRNRHKDGNVVDVEAGN